MNLGLIAIVVAGLLVVGGITAVNAYTPNNSETISCETCGNSCTSESNCGLESCGAVSGGSCGGEK